MRSSAVDVVSPSRSAPKSAQPFASPTPSPSASSPQRITLSTYPAVAASLPSSVPLVSPNSAPTPSHPLNHQQQQQQRRPSKPIQTFTPAKATGSSISTPSLSPVSPVPAAPSPVIPPSLPRRPSFSSFSLLSALRCLHLPAAQWLLERGASLAAEEAEEGCCLLDVVWEMVRDDRNGSSTSHHHEGHELEEDEEREEEQKWAEHEPDTTPPRLRRSVSSQSATSRPRAREHGAVIQRLTLDRRKSTPLPAHQPPANTRLPSSASTYLALSPLATVQVYRGPVPFSATLSALLLLLMPHSTSLTLPTLPASPPPSLSSIHSLAAFYSHLYPLLLTLHSNTASLALTHAHILDDVNHTLTALTAQQRREQEQHEKDEGGAGEVTGRQRVTAAQIRWRQKKEELDQANTERDMEVMEYVRERAADVEKEAEWAAERVEQQLLKVASEERRVAGEVKDQRRLQRRIASMETRYEESRRLSAESSERCKLLAQQTSAFSSQLALVAEALNAERSKSTQDEIDLVSVRLSQQQHCMLLFRPRARLFRKSLLRDSHPQLRLILPPSLCLQSSEVVRHTQSPSWADWRVQVSAVGGSSSRWRFEVWDVEERASGRRKEARVCGCWSSVSEVLLEAGQDVELQLLDSESAEDGEQVGILWLSAVQIAYV